MHCNENLKHIFSEMKTEYIHVSGSDLYSIFHDWSYLESLVSFIAWENSRLNRRRGKKGRELLPALPSAPAVEPESSHKKLPADKFPVWKITDHQWKQLILVVSFLFVLRVNEIPKKTFIFDYHRPFTCSVQLKKPDVFFSHEYFFRSLSWIIAWDSGILFFARYYCS